MLNTDILNDLFSQQVRYHDLLWSLGDGTAVTEDDKILVPSAIVQHDRGEMFPGVSACVYFIGGVFVRLPVNSETYDFEYSEATLFMPRGSFKLEKEPLTPIYISSAMDEMCNTGISAGDPEKPETEDNYARRLKTIIEAQRPLIKEKVHQRLAESQAARKSRLG